jgi:hypothetical protein
MKTINQYINESITSKEDFCCKYVNDMTQNDVIKYDNGNIQFVTKDDNGKDLVIAEFTKNNQFREYYKKSKKRK